jgi:hypothetical protein
MKRFLLNLLGPLAVGAMISLQPSTALSQGTAFTMLTITNPAPVVGDNFGWSVAAVGTNRLLVGTPFKEKATGAAYLFDANGTKLTTFTNPTPAFDDRFGFSVAAVGTDRVLIGAFSDDTGATNAGAAYLFSTNGALLMTYTNPTPAEYDSFGSCVAAVGNDRVLIGALQDNTGESDAGAAYLFATNGGLLTTFTNPTPAAGEEFGYSVAAVGSDRVLIGAHLDSTGSGNAGIAYLFSTNGALLVTLTNPTPANSDAFGASVAAVGTDRLFIGSPSKANATGVAYLFSTNGTLLTTFTNPTPVAEDHFGASVAAVGTDRLLIGAYEDDTGGTDTGSAYLFSTNGTLLTTFTNPPPANRDQFSYSVAAVGTDSVLIGAHYDNTGATAAGVAYLYRLQSTVAPSLSIQAPSTNALLISWPSPSIGFTLQQNTNGIGTLNWINVIDPPTDNGTIKYVIIVNPPSGNQFYRLLKE